MIPFLTERGNDCLEQTEGDIKTVFFKIKKPLSAK